MKKKKTCSVKLSRSRSNRMKSIGYRQTKKLQRVGTLSRHPVQIRTLEFLGGFGGITITTNAMNATEEKSWRRPEPRDEVSNSEEFNFRLANKPLSNGRKEMKNNLNRLSAGSQAELTQ